MTDLPNVPLTGDNTPIKVMPRNKTGQPPPDDSGLAGTFDQFLNLLTTQLKNQDPLSPMESAQFTNQLVGFAGVEQSIKSNTKLESLIGLQGGQQKLGAISLIGKDIQAVGQRTVLKQTGAKWHYTLPQEVDQVKIQVVDQQGRLVFTADSRPRTNGAPPLAKTTAGSHEFKWDGQSRTGGTAQPGDVYTLIVKAIDKQGKQIEVETDISGRVTGVTTAGNRTHLIVDNKISAGLDTLISVKNVTTPADSLASDPPASG